MVVPVGVEGEVAEEFAFFADDSDVEVGDEHDDSSAFVGSTDADVVEFGSVAQREDSARVDLVVADPGVGSDRVFLGVW